MVGYFGVFLVFVAVVSPPALVVEAGRGGSLLGSTFYESSWRVSIGFYGVVFFVEVGEVCEDFIY